MSDVDKAVEDVNEMAINFEKMKTDMEAKMEELLKGQANMNKAMVRGNEEEKKSGRTYGISQAKKEIAMGKTAKVPMWDDKTEKSFQTYLQMVNEKDYKAIEKAWADDVQDGVSNWTPTEFRSEIIRLAVQNSIALQQCTVVPMSRDKMDIPTPTGNYTVTWTDAGSVIDDSKITTGKTQLDTAKLGAIALVNNEDLADPAIPLASYIAVQMGEDYGKKIDTEVFRGYPVGDSTTYQFNGWGYASSVNAVTGDSYPDTFAGLLTEDNLLAVVATLTDQEREGAQWYFTNTAWNAVRAIEDGASSKIVRLNENYKYDLLGYPLNLRDQVSGSSATANMPIGFFGNMKWIYIGDRMDFAINTSEHYRFAYDQTVFMGIQRIAISVALPSALARITFGDSS